MSVLRGFTVDLKFEEIDDFVRKISYYFFITRQREEIESSMEGLESSRVQKIPQDAIKVLTYDAYSPTVDDIRYL